MKYKGCMKNMLRKSGVRPTREHRRPKLMLQGSRSFATGRMVGQHRGQESNAGTDALGRDQSGELTKNLPATSVPCRFDPRRDSHRRYLPLCLEALPPVLCSIDNYPNTTPTPIYFADGILAEFGLTKRLTVSPSRTGRLKNRPIGKVSVSDLSSQGSNQG